MTRSKTSAEMADLDKSCRKVIFNPRLENNFTLSDQFKKSLAVRASQIYTN